jgi:hypothetical protein
MPEDGAALRAYARIHGAYQLLRFTSPPQPPAFILFQLPFVMAALVIPSRLTLAGSALANVLTIMLHLPAVVDMDHWAMHTDVAVLTLLCLAGASGASGGGAKRDGTIATVVRLEMAVFYLASGVWKVTADHTDPQLSCSSLMLVQILCGWLPQRLLPASLLSFVAHAAPWVTLVVELGAGLLLLGPRRGGQRIGVLLALALHAGIMIAPLPLSIADFSWCGTENAFLAPFP